MRTFKRLGRFEMEWMMRTILLVGFFTLATGSARANDKTLFVNGFNAASYGDLTVDKGDWRGESMSALRVKVGLQLIRIDFVGLSIGYQKAGFYTATKAWDRDKGSVTYDYRGPVAELHLFPGSRVNLSLAASQNEGFSVRTEEDQTLYPFTPEAGREINAERWSIEGPEYTVQLGVQIARQLQVTVGVGQRNFEGTPSYDTHRRDSDGKKVDRIFVENEAGKAKDKSNFYFFGIRGSQF